MASHPDGPDPERADLTMLLREHGAGRRDRESRLMTGVYAELRKIADAHVRGRQADRTLQPTVLVHEAYLKLFDQSRLDVNNRHHFYALAAVAMRRLVVDDARRSSRKKRGGDQRRLPLDEAFAEAADEMGVDLLDLDLALSELAEADEQQSRVVELRFFGGLEIAEIADVLGVSKRTIEREWRSARAWLHHKLKPRREP